MNDNFESMATRRAYLHIGLPKTGTTYLQDRLWRNRDAALQQGLLYPGEIREAHFHAAVHIQPTRYLDWVDPAQTGAWDRLVDEIRRWPGSSLISHELLSTASEEQAAQAIKSLDFAEVHVVCTVRDLARQIPSVWQENIKNQYTNTFSEFLDSIRDPFRSDDPFWEFQDLSRILSNWGHDLPADRVHVVTMPSPFDSAHVLWQRFNSLLGIDAERLTHDLPPANSTLDAVQLELLRRLNDRLRGNIAWARYESAVKECLAGNILIVAPRRQMVTLPAEEFGWVSAKAAEFVAYLRAQRYHIVGDLGDLEPRPLSVSPVDIDVHDLLDVALDTLTEVVHTMPLSGRERNRGEWLKAALRGQHRRLLAFWRALGR